MIRRSVLFAVLGLFMLSSSALAGPPEPPFIAGSCAPKGPMDVARPDACQRILYKVGPLHVTPGDNLILAGPITIERPMIDGFIVRFKPDLERVDGSIPPIDVLHLHHAVWIATSFGDPLFASGEEKTIVSIPNGYGIENRPLNGVWLLNYMLHNQTPVPDNVFITYEIDIIPRASAPETKKVEPVWLNVASYNGFNPIYNTQRGYGSVPGECAYPKENCAGFDPFGKQLPGNGKAGNGLGHVQAISSGTIVFMLGHLHPGGLRVDLDVRRAGVRRRIFTSDAEYYDPGGPVSWDLSMEVTRPDYRVRINSGDELIMNSVYETKLASWYEGMGIVIMFLARGDTSGPDPFATPVDPDATGPTHGHMAEADNHGGGREPPLQPGTPVDTNRVSITGFSYLPGNLGLPTYPVVKRGTSLEFTNLDAGQSIFHTVTACAVPCTGATGISYPLANGAVDFDSLELGYGPPSATAAANRLNFFLPTAELQPGPYTYFCRVHPSMRGRFDIAA